MIIDKKTRLTKADKHLAKTKAKHKEEPTTPPADDPKETSERKVTHRVTVDFSTLNTLTSTRKYISLPKIDETVAKFADCHCTALDLSNFFSQIELDAASKNIFNFYYLDHVMSYNRAPQGWQSSPFFGILALKLTFS